MTYALDAKFLPGQYTIATLPAAADNTRKYAWATDLFGGPGDYVISDGVYWKPVRPLATASMAAAAGTSTLTALLNAPTQFVTGSIATGVVMTLAFSTQYAYPGAKFRVIRTAGGLGTLLGLVGIAVNGWVDYEFNGTAWVQTASGGLL